MRDWRLREREHSVGWISNDESLKNGVIICEGGGATANNNHVNIFNIKIEIGKDADPAQLRQILDILQQFQGQPEIAMNDEPKPRRRFLK